MRIEVDLYSDTLTKPTAEMRRFMCDAEVGDEQKGEDPTVNLLQEMVAELLGKEAARLPALGHHVQRDRAARALPARRRDARPPHRAPDPLRDRRAGGAGRGQRRARSTARAASSTPRRLEAGIRSDSRYSPRSRLLWVEQTSNLGGGSIWPLERIRAVTDVARRHGLRTHMDGARLMNAVVASGVSARDVRRRPSTRRGSTSPRGSARRSARRWPARATSSPRRGAASSRWAGPCARPASSRPAASTRCATTSSAWPRTTPTRGASPRGWPGLPGVALDPATVETNLVFFDLTGAARRRRPRSSACSPTACAWARMGPRTVRAVTHLDVSAAQVERALDAARAIFTG